MDSSVTFVRIPKNASTSIYESLGAANTIRNEKISRLYSSRHSIKTSEERYKGKVAPSHCVLREAVDKLGDEILEVPSFGVVRNPYDRLASMYCHARSYNLMFHLSQDFQDYSFGSFCRALLELEGRSNFLHAYSVGPNPIDILIAHSLTQKSYLILNDKIGVDRVLKFENINEEFKKFITDYKILNVDPVLPHKNSPNRAAYKDFFCKETKKIVKRMWEEDLDEFKYTYSSPEYN